MNRLKNLLVIFMLLVPVVSWAQMNNFTEDPTEKTKVQFQDTIRTTTRVEHDYFSPARERARLAAIRRERNNLKIMGGMNGSLTSLNEQWIKTSGGDNTIALLASFNVDHTYTYKRFVLTNKASAKFGYNNINIEIPSDNPDAPEEKGVWFKNQDEIFLSTSPALKLDNIWSYGASFMFRTQFASGYVSRPQQEAIHLKSSFMAPGYLDISIGVNYNSPYPKVPIKVSLSPVALSAVYVNNAAVRENFLYQFKDHTNGDDGSAKNWKYTDPYGVSPFESSKYEGGSSIKIDYSDTFGPDKSITYNTSIYSFYGWMSQVTYSNIYRNYDEYQIALDAWTKDQSSSVKPMLSIQPTLRWENTVIFKATKYISTTLNFQLYYNRAQSVRIQTQTLLSVGLIYTFTNK